MPAQAAYSRGFQARFCNRVFYYPFIISHATIDFHNNLAIQKYKDRHKEGGLEVCIHMYHVSRGIQYISTLPVRNWPGFFNACAGGYNGNTAFHIIEHLLQSVLYPKNTLKSRRKKSPNGDFFFHRIGWDYSAAASVSVAWAAASSAGASTSSSASTFFVPNVRTLPATKASISSWVWAT